MCPEESVLVDTGWGRGGDSGCRQSSEEEQHRDAVTTGNDCTGHRVLYTGCRRQVHNWESSSFIHKRGSSITRNILSEDVYATWLLLCGQNVAKITSTPVRPLSESLPLSVSVSSLVKLKA